MIMENDSQRIAPPRAPLPAKGGVGGGSIYGGAGGGFACNERGSLIRDALLRTVAFFDATDYAPLWSECMAWIEWHGSSGFESQAVPNSQELNHVKDECVRLGLLTEGEGRIALTHRFNDLISLVHERQSYMPRKFRRARRIARWLARFRAVRFVALVNTTPLGNARNGGDLDIFVIVRAGHIWTIRLLAGLPYRMLGRLSSDDAAPDAVCLSYYISDNALDLSHHMLAPDDPYFRYWFLSMLPLYDDGISVELWKQNESIRCIHPRVEAWMLSPDLAIPIPRWRIPCFTWFESTARKLQVSWFPKRIRERMNRDTSVIVTDAALKFHVEDGREEYRKKYEENLVNIVNQST
jgi:hypothetical protein